MNAPASPHPAPAPAVPAPPPPPGLPTTNRPWVLFMTFGGLVSAGFQLGLMALASLSVSRHLMAARYDDAAAGDWFARHTAAIMLGAAIGGILLGSLGDRVGRTRAMGLSILCYSLFGGAGAL